MPATGSRIEAWTLLFQSYFDIEVNTDESSSKARKLYGAVSECREELEEIISKNLAKGWTLTRISKESRAVLSLALYEILHDEKTPNAVAINEAIEIIKVYGADEDYRFVNAILDKYAN